MLLATETREASDLRVARCLDEIKALQRSAEERGERGANLGDILSKYGGAKESLRLQQVSGSVEYSFSGADQNEIISSPLYRIN